MKKIFTFVLLVVSSSLAIADTWTNPSKINRIYPTDVGLNIVLEDYANKNLSSCNNGQRYLVPIDHPNYEVYASAMMMAFVSGKKVYMFIKNQALDCSLTIDRFMVLSNQ